MSLDHPTLALHRQQVLCVAGVVEQLALWGRVLLPEPPGTGKTTLIDGLLASTLVRDRYDLVVYAGGTTELLDERERKLWARAVPLLRLTGRPGSRCGDLDAVWKQAERQRTGHLGRAEICEQRCSSRSVCPWPQQFSPEAFRGCTTLLIPQVYLLNMPDLVRRVAQLTGAKRPLVIMDESSILDSACFERILPSWIQMTATAAQAVATPASTRLGTRLSALLTALYTHPDEAAQTRLWLPHLEEDELLAMEQAGVRLFGGAFRNVLGDLAAFTGTPAQHRCWHGDHLRYRALPRFPDGVDVLLAAAHLDLRLLRWLMNDPRWSAGASPELLHPGTRIVNIRTSASSARNFAKNAPQILDIAAQLCHRALARGERALVITRKSMAELVRGQLSGLFRKESIPLTAVLAGDADVADLLQVPILHYGLRGTNRFESYGLAICVTSYNVPARAVEEFLNGARPPSLESAVQVLQGPGPTRRASVTRTRSAQTWVDASMAESAQQHVEERLVLQAVGRVRPWSHARTIVMCHQGPLSIRVDAEYSSWAEFRSAEGMKCQRDRQHSGRVEQAHAMQQAGATISELASFFGISERSVWRMLATDTNPIIRDSPVLGFVSVPQAVSGTAEAS